MMAQTIQLISTLKQALKVHGFSYKDVAEQLVLSEASVKRLLSEYRLSLERLDSICQMMDMEISDLVVEMNQQAMSDRVSQLSEEQEKELAADTVLLLVTVCVLNGWTKADLQSHYHLMSVQCVHYLAVLDRLQLITLLPKNKIKLRVATSFTWRQNGPIQQFFQDKLAADFFKSTFDNQDEQLTVINGMLSEKAMMVFQRKLGQLALDFEALNNEDRVLPLSQRKGKTVVLAARNWQFGLFDSLRK
jgi:DNA-binding Xre family transcriptional regulator